MSLKTIYQIKRVDGNDGGICSVQSEFPSAQAAVDHMRQLHSKEAEKAREGGTTPPQMVYYLYMIVEGVTIAFTASECLGVVFQDGPNDRVVGVVPFEWYDMWGNRLGKVGGAGAIV